GATVMAQGDALKGESVEMVASRHPSQDAMDAYERLLGDAMAGDAILFARQDYVEEAWRIVDPVLKAATPVHEYDKGTWGPADVDHRGLPAGGCHNPAVPDQEDWRVDQKRTEEEADEARLVR